MYNRGCFIDLSGSDLILSHFLAIGRLIFTPCEAIT